MTIYMSAGDFMFINSIITATFYLLITWFQPISSLRPIFTVPSSFSNPPPLSFLVAIFPVPFLFVNSPIDCSSDLPGAPCLGDLPGCTLFICFMLVFHHHCSFFFVHCTPIFLLGAPSLSSFFFVSSPIVEWSSGLPRAVWFQPVTHFS